MKKRTKKRTIWVAAVVVMSGKDLMNSKRQYGDWASFISEDREDAIARAREAKERWEISMGPIYTIIIGTLTERIVFPVVYTVETL
jgi:uncharacterized protein with NRDE domain